MGINFILPIIIGLAMTTIIGASVGPSLVENMKITKVENKTIGNQVAIKDAIERYIVITGKYPKDFDDLKSQGLLKDYHKDNLFSGGYSFLINEEKGTLTIYTQFDDDKAGKYFKNSLKTSNTPTCVEKVGEACKDNLYETFYLLPFLKKVAGIEAGSKNNIENRFTKLEEVGKKFDKTTLVGGEKDYIVDIPNNTVVKYVYNKGLDTWEKNSIITNIGGFGKETNVFISDLDITYLIWNGTNLETNTYKHEKVHCKDTSLSNKEVFVINENTGLGELIWVAPDNVSTIKNKITSNNYTPNNICTSDVTNMSKLFSYDMMFDVTPFMRNFNSPLNRLDTSNVNDMEDMFCYGN